MEEINKPLLNKNNNLLRQEPLVSIIVSISNHAHLLHTCLDSIIEQTYPNLEIILIDNDSSDSSLQVCEKFAKKDKRIQVYTKIFEATSDMQIFGLQKANGEYITFMSGADFISLNYIEYHLELLSMYDADISECSFIKVPERDVAENIFEPPVQNEERVKVLLPWQAIENLHSVSYETCLRTVVLWNKLFKRTVFENVEIPVEKNFEDEFITYKLFRNANKIVCSNQILYGYVQIGYFKHKKVYDEHRLDILEAYENYMKFFKKMNSPYMLARAGRRYLRIMLIIRKEISTFDVILIKKDQIIEKLDTRFMTIYKFLNVLSDKYPYLAEEKSTYKTYLNQYKTYIKIVNSFNAEYLKYKHNQIRQNFGQGDRHLRRNQRKVEDIMKDFLEELNKKKERENENKKEEKNEDQET